MKVEREEEETKLEMRGEGEIGDSSFFRCIDISLDGRFPVLTRSFGRERGDRITVIYPRFKILRLRWIPINTRKRAI